MNKANFGFIAAIMFFILANASTVLAEGMPGTIEGTGTHFEIIDSAYLNITLDSTETISVMLQSVPQIVTLYIQQSAEAASTTITIAGLQPLTTYYKYEDNYYNLVEFTTDGTGKYAYAQDLSQEHFIFIQTTPSTLHIINTSTGGDCSLIGNWNGTTCTMTTNLDSTVHKAIQIDDSGIIFDGAEHTIYSNPQSAGIFSEGTTGITIKNVKTENAGAGIRLFNCNGSTITGNTLSNGSMGISIVSSNNNTIVNNNFIDNTDTQAYVYNSIGNVFNLDKPIGGNYWSDYNTEAKGCYDVAPADGFCDSDYNSTVGKIFGGQDHLPLVNPFILPSPSEDITPPVTAISLSRTAGTNGWYVSDVLVTLTATDDSSGVKSTEYSFDETTWTNYAPFTVSTEGTTTVDYRSKDNAGNVEATKSESLKIDKTKPSIVGSKTPGPNANGWNNTDITVHFACTDTLSTIESCTPDTTLSTDGAGQTVTGTATDLAGNTAETTVSEINIDKTKPSITGSRTPTANANGWNNTDVTVHFDCTDSTAGIASCSADSTISTEGANQEIIGTATDLAGNTAETTVSEINIDKTEPSISISAPVDYGVYPIGIALVFSATDSLSGVVKPVQGKLTNIEGTIIDVSTGYQPAVGVYNLVVSATDKAGNTKTSSPIQFVVYDPTGGFVTGGGWFNPDAAGSNLSSEGRASFGFVAKYLKGKATGNLEFQYKNGDSINFKSTAISLLAVGNASAEFQGTGTINGTGPYTFKVRVTDNGEPGTADSFEIKIWNGTSATGDPVYKAYNTLAGGNIVVHKK